MPEGNYEELRAQYRAYKIRVVAAPYSSDVEGLEVAVEEVPKLERQLVEFCLSNGYDLQDLQQFFRDVDNDAMQAAWVPS